jgi:hypothetical protein
VEPSHFIQEIAMQTKHTFPAALAGLVLAAAGSAMPAFAQERGSCAPNAAAAELDQAVHDLDRQQPDQAAQDLRRAAVAVGDLADKAASDERAALRSQVRVLESAARDVDAGKLRSGTVLQRRLARVDADLANQQLATSARAWAARDYCKAGDALATAAHHVESGLQAVGSAVRADVHKAAEFGQRVTREGEKTVAADFEHARDAVRKELAALRARLGSHA